MTQEIINQIILFVFSFLANLFASVSGGGAGFVQFPLLIFMGLPFATALGTHKVAVVFLGIGAIAKQKSNFAILDKRIALIMLLAGAPAVVAGTLIVINIPTQIAEFVLGIITVGSGIYTFFKKGFGTTNQQDLSTTRIIVGTLFIILVGMFSGSLSSGAGLFATLTLVMIFKLDLKKAIFHTMVFVATIWNAIGAITVGALTAIYWQWVPAMIIASFTGAFVGTMLLFKLPVKIVRIIFSLVSIASGILLIVASF